MFDPLFFFLLSGGYFFSVVVGMRLGHVCGRLILEFRGLQVGILGRVVCFRVLEVTRIRTSEDFCFVFGSSSRRLPPCSGHLILLDPVITDYSCPLTFTFASEL